MPSADSHALQEAIRRTLAHRTGAGADASAVVDATLETWRLMAGRLIPVIGTKGVDALLARALQLTGRTHAWPAGVEEGGDSATVFANLKRGWAGHDALPVAQASEALLVTFTQLLSSLIGAFLTERLLRPAWVPVPPASERESTS